MRDKLKFIICFVGISIGLVGLTLSIVNYNNVLFSLILINITLILELLFLVLFFIYHDKTKRKNNLLLQSIIHDIKTPVYSIINLLDNERERIDSVNFDKIQLSSKNLLNTVNSFIEFSKIQYNKILLKKEKFYLGDVISEVFAILSPLAKEKNIKLNIYNNNITHETVIGDKDKLINVLINIISNSIKYTKEYGSVKLIISEGIKEGKTCLVFSIEDTGIGMSKEFIETIFNPFTREKKKYVERNNGTGLGMFITNSFVRIMKGKIEVRSKENIGSIFTITIPFVTCASSDYSILQDKKIVYYDEDIIDYHYCFNALKSLNENVTYCKDLSSLENVLDDCDYLIMNSNGIMEYFNDNIKSKVKIIDINKAIFKKDICNLLLNQDVKENNFLGKRILIADDNEINLEITTDIIKNKGIIVDTAEDGLGLLKKFLSSKINYYDAIMTDIHMPVIDGYDVCDKIRNLDREDAKSIPIIVVSAANNEYDKKIFDSLNITDYIDKPININNLTKVLIKHLNR